MIHIKKRAFTELVLFLCITMILMSCIKSNIYAASNPKVSKTNLYMDIWNGYCVNVLSVGGKNYLFLPSDADYTDISLKCMEEERNVSYIVNGIDVNTINLDDVVPEENVYKVNVKITNSDNSGFELLELNVMKGDSIGTVYYVSDDSVSHGLNWVESAKGNKSSGKALVIDSNGNVVNNKEKNQIVSDIHGRGSSSWLDPKKGYQLKFDKKSSLVGGTAEAKKWLLLAQYKDPLRMSDKICKNIASATTRSDYSPKEEWVNFYYDGEYRGVYLLSEKNEVYQGRVPVTDMEEFYEKQDKTYGKTTNVLSSKNKYGNSYLYQDGLKGPSEVGGVLVEMNMNVVDEANGFQFKVGTSQQSANIKSPELGSKYAVKYISEYFQEFCDAVTATDENGNHTGKNPTTGLYYYDYCDIDSLVDTYMIQAISSNSDAFWKSQYFYKEKNEKMIAGPVWDMDLTFGTGFYNQITADYNVLQSTAITRDLIKIPSFQKKVKERYMNCLSGELGRLASTDFNNYFTTVENNIAMDEVLWPIKYKSGDGTIRWGDNDSFVDIVNYRIRWIAQHKSFLDSFFKNLSVSEADTHLYDDAVAKTSTTHTRRCFFHKNETITENCIIVTTGNEDGTHTTKCTACNNKTIESCTYGVVDNKNGTHKKTCKKCGDSITENHIFSEKYTIDKEPTCLDEGKESIRCMICGKIKDGSSRSVPKVEHKYGKWQIKEATETDAGQKSRICSFCGKVQKETIAQLAPTLPAVRIIDPKGKRKSAVVRWKTISKAKRKKIKKIEIRYSTDRDFRTNTKTVTASAKKSSKKIKKLVKGETYYIRIRAYSNGHVSAWSAVKEVKAR